MKIPTELKIGAHTYRVFRKVDGFCASPCIGQTNYATGEIWIDSELTGTMLGATLFHEILHCINSELDHVLLDSLSQQIYQVLHDNDLLK